MLHYTDLKWAIWYFLLVWRQCGDRMQAAPPSPFLEREREQGPPPPYLYVHIGQVFVHAHMICMYFGFMLRCVCLSQGLKYAGMYVIEGGPALLPFTSTAIEHLCLALLLVATVTKRSVEWLLQPNRKQETEEKGKKDREGDFACSSNHNSRSNTTYPKTLPWLKCQLHERWVWIRWWPRRTVVECSRSTAVHWVWLDWVWVTAHSFCI